MSDHSPRANSSYHQASSNYGYTSKVQNPSSERFGLADSIGEREASFSASASASVVNSRGGRNSISDREKQDSIFYRTSGASGTGFHTDVGAHSTDMFSFNDFKGSLNAYGKSDGSGSGGDMMENRERNGGEFQTQLSNSTLRSNSTLNEMSASGLDLDSMSSDSGGSRCDSASASSRRGMSEILLTSPYYCKFSHNCNLDYYFIF